MNVFKKIFLINLAFLLLLFFALPCIADLSPEKIYEIAREKYHSLMTLSSGSKIHRQSWNHAISLFEEVYGKNPRGSLADDSLFSVANLYRELFLRAGDRRDLEKAIQYYQSVYQKFPKSNLADDACFISGEAYFLFKKDLSGAYSAYTKIIENYPKGDKYLSAKIRLREIRQFYSNQINQKEEEKFNEIKGVRHWSNPKYTRIVIDLDKQVAYKETQKKKLNRIYIDFFNTKLSPSVKKHLFKIGDGLLKSIRVGTVTKDTSRVIIDIDRISKYKIFALDNPFRIVIDVKLEKEKEKRVVEKRKEETVPLRKKKEEIKPRPPRTMTIVIDPGHGGKDSGAVGPNGLKEKTVVLDIAKRLKKILREKTRYKVLLTREKDVYISLEERTAIANTLNADLFVSIHANASRRRGAIGVETYFLDYTFNEDILETVARENNAPVLLKDDLQAILFDLKKTRDSNESAVLANSIQETMVSNLNSKYSKLLDRGAKAGPFYVLFGAEMPSVLVETLFISNRKEERLLKSYIYRQKIAEAIFDGIKIYLEKNKGI